jgi:hypothetical protein
LRVHPGWTTPEARACPLPLCLPAPRRAASATSSDPRLPRCALWHPRRAASTDFAGCSIAPRSRLVIIKGADLIVNPAGEAPAVRLGLNRRWLTPSPPPARSSLYENHPAESGARHNAKGEKRGAAKQSLRIHYSTVIRLPLRRLKDYKQRYEQKRSRDPDRHE